MWTKRVAELGECQVPTVKVLDSEMYYVATPGAGTPIVFLHGNPTSSYLWRHVLPLVAEQPAHGAVRCLAPDLIGMGQSGRPAIEYRFTDHACYLDAWCDALGMGEIVFVGHDWGGALAFDYARRHPERIRGIAFLETIVKPMAWEDFAAEAGQALAALRTPGEGEALVLDQNIFIEQVLRATIMTGLSDDDLEVYRAPYPTRGSRLPLLQWPRSLPLAEYPPDVVAIVQGYDEWLTASSAVPKLLLTFDPGPGTMIGPELVAWCQANIVGLETAYCGPAGHQAPEDQPVAIAEAITAWAGKHQLLATTARSPTFSAAIDELISADEGEPARARSRGCKSGRRPGR
jgi:haloalkane dehalogenase